MLLKPLAGRDFVQAVVSEEKGSDVTLASHLVWDACHRLIDRALIISNDSDLQTPVTMGHDVGREGDPREPTPSQRQADNLHGDDRRNLTRRHLAACQLPERTWDAEGREVRCPAAWKA